MLAPITATADKRQNETHAEWTNGNLNIREAELRGRDHLFMPRFLGVPPRPPASLRSKSVYIYSCCAHLERSEAGGSGGTPSKKREGVFSTTEVVQFSSSYGLCERKLELEDFIREFKSYFIQVVLI